MNQGASDLILLRCPFSSTLSRLVAFFQRDVGIKRYIIFVSVLRDTKQIPHNVRECRALCDMNTVIHISLEVLLDPTGEFQHFPMCSYYSFFFFLQAVLLTVLPPRYFRAWRDSTFVPIVFFPPADAS